MSRQLWLHAEKCAFRLILGCSGQWQCTSLTVSQEHFVIWKEIIQSASDLNFHEPMLFVCESQFEMPQLQFLRLTLTCLVSLFRFPVRSLATSLWGMEWYTELDHWLSTYRLKTLHSSHWLYVQVVPWFVFGAQWLLHCTFSWQGAAPAVQS